MKGPRLTCRSGHSASLAADCSRESVNWLFARRGLPLCRCCPPTVHSRRAAAATGRCRVYTGTSARHVAARAPRSPYAPRVHCSWRLVELLLCERQRVSTRTTGRHVLRLLRHGLPLFRVASSKLSGRVVCQPSNPATSVVWRHGGISLHREKRQLGRAMLTPQHQGRPCGPAALLDDLERVTLRPPVRRRRAAVIAVALAVGFTAATILPPGLHGVPQVWLVCVVLMSVMTGASLLWSP